MHISLHNFETLARVSLGIICVLLETVEIDSTAAEVHFDTIFDGVVDGSLGADAHFIRTSGFTNERASEKGEHSGRKLRNREFLTCQGQSGQPILTGLCDKLLMTVCYHSYAISYLYHP